MLVGIRLVVIVGLAPLFVCQNNDSSSGDGSGVDDSSMSLINPTTAVVIEPSTSAIENINPTPLASISDYITSEQSQQFVGMLLNYTVVMVTVCII